MTPKSEARRSPPSSCGNADDSLRFFCAGDGQDGGGVIIFDNLGVHAIPAADTAWREATKGNRKDANKLRATDGSWKLWFLLTRARVLTEDALAAGECELAPVDPVEVALMYPPITALDYAARQMREASIARHLAVQARQHVIIYALAVDASISIEMVRDEQLFIAWYWGIIAGRTAVGDLALVEAVKGFAEIVKRMPQDVPAEVRDLCFAIAAAAQRVGDVPTKREVRRETAKTNWVYDDERLHRELRKRAGFQWLPQDKSGPQ